MAAMDRILNACTRATLAEGALYAYARGGTTISGPSIRLAEAIAQNWGNLQFGIRELEQRNGESTVEAFAWDIETNTRQVKVFQVPHVRHTRQGQKKLEDPRDIYELVANQGARRLRACILGVVPGDVVESAVNQCEVTLSVDVDVTPEGIAKLLEKFSEFSITKEQIEKRIQRRIESILPAQVLSLRKIYNSMRDAMSFPSDWFEGVESGRKEPSSKPVIAEAPEEPPANAPKETAVNTTVENSEVLTEWRGIVSTEMKENPAKTKSWLAVKVGDKICNTLDGDLAQAAISLDGKECAVFARDGKKAGSFELVSLEEVK